MTTVWRRIGLVLALAALPVVAWTPPASAQQLIDAGGGEGEGGLAFVAFALMCFLTVGALFFMDRVRRRRDEREDR
ncbi:MAG: hypothetical protein ACRDZ1_15475 [Acidimicrobiia bacterium]